MSLTPISFGKEEGTRLELSLKVRVKKEARKIENKSVVFSNGYNLENLNDQLTESKIENEFQSVYQFDLFKQRAHRWLWLHKDECLVNS